MTTRCSRDATEAFTLIEVLVVLAIVALLIAMLFPMRYHGDVTPRTACMSHLRQVQIGLIEWQADNGNAFPWQVPTTNGGTMELADDGNVYPHFLALAKYKIPPSNFICPSDKSRKAVDNSAKVANWNISYFLNLVAGTNNPTSSILVGDRNLQVDGQPAKPGLFLATTNHELSWTRELHRGVGNLGFADGHGEFCKTNSLSTKFLKQHVAVSRLVIP